MGKQVRTHGVLWCFSPGKNSPCKMKKETEDCVNCPVRAWGRSAENQAVGEKEQQRQLWQPTQQEYAELFQTNKADIWLENKKLKAALQQAAEIVAKNYCPANYDCPLEDTECGGGAECTQEIAERCWMEHWMEEESNG